MSQKGEDITTRFKVDISDLKAGISQANQQIKLAKSEFNSASSSMDDWAKTSDGLNAKLKQLNSVLDAENSKLNSYKEQLLRVTEASQENEKRANELKAKLTQLINEGVSKTSDEFKEYEKALNGVESEQISNQKAIDNLNIKINNQQAVVNKTKLEIGKYNDELREVSEAENMSAKNGKSLEDNLSKIRKGTEESSGGFSILKGTLANFTANILTSTISKIGELASSMFELVDATEEHRSMMSKLSGASKTFGYDQEFAQGQFKEFYKYLGDSQMATNAITNLMGIGTSTENLSRIAEGAIATWASFGDSFSLESLTEAINETINVGKVTGAFADTINWTSISNQQLASILGEGTEAQRLFNQAIVDGKTKEDAFNDALSATSDQGERANIVANFLNDVFGESKNTYDELNGAMLDANQTELELMDAQSKLAETVSPVKNVFTDLKTKALEAIQPVVTALVQKFFELIEYLKEHPTLLAIVTSAVVALATSFGVLATALAIQGIIKGVALAMAFLNTTFLANPITLIIAAILGLVAGIIVLWNKSEGFRNFVIETWEKLKEVFSEVGGWIYTYVISPVIGFFAEMYDKITGFFQKLPDFFKNLWDRIKNTFTSLGTKIGDAISGAVKSGINGVISLVQNRINKAIDLINGAIKLINKIPGVNIGKISRVNFPRLYQGGVLKKGQVGVLEGSGDEAVVPLHNNKKWIKRVADDMKTELQNGNVSNISNPTTNNVNNFTQNIYANQAPSRAEIYKDTRNLLNYKLRRV